MHHSFKTLFTPVILPIMTMALSCNNGNHRPNNGAGPAISIKWKKLGALPGSHLQQTLTAHPGLAGPVTGITGNFLVVGGGSNFPGGLPWQGGTKTYYDTLYVYALHPTDHTTAGKTGDSAVLTDIAAHLPYAAGYPACVSLPEGIVIAGGENKQGPLRNVSLITLSPAKDSITIRALPDLPEASSGAMITAIGTTLYFAGGNTANGKTSSRFLSLDLKDTSGGWQQLPDLPQPTSFGVLYADPDANTLYLAGGRKANPQARTSFFASLFSFSVQTQSWHKKADLPYSVSAATGVRSQNKLLLFGGDQGETFHKTEDLLLKIAAAKDNNEKELFIRQKNKLQQQHPGFTHQILAYDIDRDSWDLAGELPFASQVTTTAISWGNKVIIPCGEIRAGVRYPDIIEAWLKPDN